MTQKVPNTLVIIFIVLSFFSLLTWIIPSGEFMYEIKAGKKTLVPNSYHEVEAAPQGISSLLMAPVKGFEQAGAIIAFVFFVGGVFGVVNATRSIEAALQGVLRWSSQNPQFKMGILALLMVLFSLTGASFGLSEEVLVFILITIPLAISLGFDSIVGVSIPLIGTAAGFGGAITNPFTIGVAHGIAGLPLFSGWEYRMVVWVVLTSISILFIIWYARKILRNPRYSLVHNLDTYHREKLEGDMQSLAFTFNRKLIVLLFLSTVVLLIIGATQWDWYVYEISALFLGLAILASFVYRMPAEVLIQTFIHGSKDMLPACFVIAFSKGIIILATEGKIIDTILYAISHSLSSFHPLASAEIMYFFQSLVNIVVPSGSGQAALTIPIMSPLADVLHLSRQTCVLIFQMGDGINNMIIPTSGVTMGTLAIARIPYEKWVRFIWPLMLMLFIACMLLIIPPVVFFEYGPL